MSEYWDWPPTKKYYRKARRQPLPLEGEILEPETEPRIRVEHYHYVHRRQRQQIPPWAVAVLAIGVLALLFPYPLVVGLVIIGLLIAMYPIVGISIAIFVALFGFIAWRERRRGRAF
jgi:hypothetical protein